MAWKTFYTLADPLSDVSDITITTITSGELLKWSGSAWVNNTLSEAGISATGHAHAASDITSGTLSHERGGLEFDASAVAIGDIIAGTGTGSMALVTASGHSDGDVLTLQADSTADWETPSAGGTHDLLSATHADTLASAVSAGSLLYGNATPKWAELDAGTLNNVLMMGASLPAWADLYGTAANWTALQTFTEGATVSSNKTLTMSGLVTWSAGTQTLAADVLTIDSTSTKIAAQSGTADDCATINTLTAFRTIYVTADTGDTITLKHNTGNLFLLNEADLAITPTDIVEFWSDGTKWYQIGGSVGIGYSDPLTTEGDILIRTASATDRLAIGTQTQVLKVDTSVSGDLVYTDLLVGEYHIDLAGYSADAGAGPNPMSFQTTNAVPGTNSWFASGTPDATTTLDALFDWTIPIGFDTTTHTLKVRFNCIRANPAQTLIQVDCQAYDQDASTTDICATAAQTLGAGTSDYDFTITDTGLAAGDQLAIWCRFIGDDTGGGGDGWSGALNRVTMVIS